MHQIDFRRERGPTATERKRAALVDVGLQLAEVDGYQWLTRDGVARAAGVAAGTVSNLCGTMREFKRAVLQAAVDRNIPTIVAQGLADRHEIALAAPEDVKRAALARLSN